MSGIISRMLMNGVRDAGDSARDITAGSIVGVHYFYDENHNRVWRMDKAPVGFPWENRNPTHQ